MCGNYSLIKFANFLIIVLRAEIGTIKAESSSNFRTLHNNEKICKLCKAIFSTHYNIFQPNFGILLLLKGSFRECSFLGQDVSRTKISQLNKCFSSYMQARLIKTVFPKALAAVF